MKAIIQRVTEASVTIHQQMHSSMNRGIVTLLGIEKGDSEEKLQKLIHRIINLRIFPDDAGKMNLSLKDIQGTHLIVSQFTLAADCFSGLRPSFGGAEAPDKARILYEKALTLSAQAGVATISGQFQADMLVRLCNDGPATFILSL